MAYVSIPSRRRRSIPLPTCPPCKPPTPWPLLLLISSYLFGCGGSDDENTPEPTGCAAETRADSYAPNLKKGGQSHSLVLLESQPAPPAKGDNTWTVQLLDPSGAPLDGATLKATPFMPDHGHGTPMTAVTTPQSAEGRYEIKPIHLGMAGYWEIEVTIETPATTDSVKFGFCIDG